MRGLDRFSDAARRRDVSIPALALAWVLSHPDITAPLVAPKDVGQFDDVATALELHLAPDDRDELAGLFQR